MPRAHVAHQVLVMEQTMVTPFEFETPTPTARPIERWASLAAASAAMTYGFRQRGLGGMWLVAAATPLAYRAVVGSWPGISRDRAARDDTRVALGGGRGVHVRESIRLEKPVDEVYRFWRHVENLPRFMTHLEQVTDLGDGRSHWVAKGPGGVNVEWDAEIISDVENKTIGWRSLPGADVVSAGSVNFSPVRGGTATQISVHLQYSAPGGRAGSWLATLTGREPSQTIRENLRRLKQLLEAGEIARTSQEQ
jgi:uncharacterized membrane protein